MTLCIKPLLTHFLSYFQNQALSQDNNAFENAKALHRATARALALASIEVATQLLVAKARRHTTLLEAHSGALPCWTHLRPFHDQNIVDLRNPQWNGVALDQDFHVPRFSFFGTQRELALRVGALGPEHIDTTSTGDTGHGSEVRTSSNDFGCTVSVGTAGAFALAFANRGGMISVATVWLSLLRPKKPLQLPRTRIHGSKMQLKTTSQIELCRIQVDYYS